MLQQDIQEKRQYVIRKMESLNEQEISHCLKTLKEAQINSYKSELNMDDSIEERL